MRATPTLRFYYAFSRWLGPALARRLLTRRVARGKEDPARLEERFGVAGASRPEGALVWLHAASVGESMSLLPLVEALCDRRPDLSLLVTSGTMTSAKMMAERLPAGVIHQFAPVDTFQAVERFLDYWRPSFMGVVESEIWPVMLSEARRRGVRTALLSARLSEKTEKGWRYAPRSIEALLSHFDVILAQNETVARRLSSLGAAPERLSVAGSLKSSAAPLPADATEVSEWRARFARRSVWLAASTHPGEELAAMEAHATLRARWPGLLTVLAPRHPERAEALAEQLRAQGWRVARRSRGETPDEATDVFMIDRLGELGLWYRLASAVLMGGTLAPVGGHNPLEPARLGAALLIGPSVESVAADVSRLEAGGALRRVEPRPGESAGPALAEELADFFAPDGRISPAAQEMGRRARELTQEDSGALDRILKAIAPLLPPAASSEGDDARA